MRNVMRWDYKTKDGNVVGHVRRLESDNSDGSSFRKQMIPYFKENGQAGIPDTLPKEHRLFGLHSIQDNSKPCFIVEGEKCAHALHGLGFQAVTSLGGSAQAHLADWDALSNAESIYILPDNDKPGTEYARDVYGLIRGFKTPSSVKIVRFPVQEKGDVCDYLKSLPELSLWNEVDSLSGHPAREAIAQTFEQYVADNSEIVPAHWKFLVTKHKHKLIAANDLATLNLPERKMLLFPWIPEGSINMIFADRGIGKTFFSLSCALALANGEKFLSYEAQEAVSVLYLDGEMQATVMKQRLHKLCHGKPTKQPINLYTPDCQVNDFIPDLGTNEGRDHINELIALSNPRAIFIDNISTFDRSGNENEAESWAPIQEWAVQHRKKGRSIIFVHHANKEGKQRGSHKKEDVMDAVIKLKRPEDHVQGEGGTKILVTYTKARHLSGEQAQDMEASLLDQDGLLRWEWTQGDITYSTAVELLKEKMPLRDIAEELGVTKSTIHRWKTRAQGEGLI